MPGIINRCARSLACAITGLLRTVRISTTCIIHDHQSSRKGQDFMFLLPAALKKAFHDANKLKSAWSHQSLLDSFELKNPPLKFVIFFAKNLSEHRTCTLCAPSQQARAFTTAILSLTESAANGRASNHQIFGSDLKQEVMSSSDLVQGTFRLSTDCGPLTRRASVSGTASRTTDCALPYVHA
jgi:hypothetical protein